MLCVEVPYRAAEVYLIELYPIEIHHIDKGARGLYFGLKTKFIPPSFLKWYFFPLSRHVVFPLPSWPFFLNSSLFCIYFTLLLPLFSFPFPFLLFSFPFLPFSFTFSPFFLFTFSYFFPQMTPADIPPPRGRYFPIYGPLKGAVEVSGLPHLERAHLQN